ncbi:MAG: hypothetical protein J6X94_00230 [Lachnospiraceae bacterium]|nr:hypothetical protein [Lachnospiraceae bacterium]
MELVKVGLDKQNIKKFVNLPKKIYSAKDNMESPSQMRSLLEGTHPLSKYFDLDAYLIIKDGDTVARFAITTYSDDTTAYLGFFESLNDKEISGFLFTEAQRIAKEKKCTVIVGPVDASFWLKYRLKINNFNLLPYTGEPYNKDYYLDLFQDSGYKVCEHYTSSAFRSVGEDYVNEKFESRYKEFLSHGYVIESPKPEDYDKVIDEVYRLITELYSDFPIYKNLSKEDFYEVFKDYKTIMNMSMTKMAYYEGKAVGFYISIPDYGNRVYHAGLFDIPGILRTRKHPDRYVMLYMGVDQNHRGLGKALVYAIMKELMQSGLPSIGALARDGKVTQDYASEEKTDIYEYVLLKHEL